LIEIDLIERDGGTLLPMTHSGLPNAVQCANHESGGAHYLGRLAVAAASNVPARIAAPCGATLNSSLVLSNKFDGRRRQEGRRPRVVKPLG
jgi:hypothetical protein